MNIKIRKKLILLFLPLLLAGCLNRPAVKNERAGINSGQAKVQSEEGVFNSSIGPSINQENQIPEAKRINVSLILKFAGQEEKYDETIEAGQTVFDLLTLAAAKNGFSLKFQNYPEMGVFITEIHGQENGQSNKYWQYTVNDHYAEKAADKLELKEGDIVTWEFKESSF